MKLTLTLAPAALRPTTSLSLLRNDEVVISKYTVTQKVVYMFEYYQPNNSYPTENKASMDVHFSLTDMKQNFHVIM